MSIYFKQPAVENTAHLKKAYACLEHVRPANYEEIITSRIKEILIQALARVSGRPRSVVWKEPPA
jgi:hypothetical protein